MIKKLLIANRGEIALRIIRSAKAMGVATVAVYSDADAHSMAVSEANQAFALPGTKATDTYLDGEKIIAIAKACGADAIHPGYGFLSEKAEFAKRCEDAGIIFVGPPSGAIEAMGSKSAAKDLMIKAKVPVVPGYQGESQTLATFKAEAKKIGYPILLKAALGGGGKGMRVVDSEPELELALEQVKREAKASFNDDQVLVEKYLREPRHVELQIFCDGQGHGVHLFERDCSIQRRHQKIVEEAPAIGVSEPLRQQMGDAALAAAKAINYRGAGTVEFLLDQDGQFYFMEMNTRLQVEHPVTEAITGLDLVALQLQVASGNKLPLTQQQVKCNGHAIEVRLYAEDPENNFLPQTGLLHLLQWPTHTTAGVATTISKDLPVRIDTGVRTGDEISIYYDPMIAKVIAWGEDRATAIAHLQQALAEIWLVGLKTNLCFLQRVLAMAPYQEGKLSTAYLDQFPVPLADNKPTADVLTLAYLARRAELHQQQLQDSQQRGLSHSPWHQFDGWRLFGLQQEQVSFMHDDESLSLLVTNQQSGMLACTDEAKITVDAVEQAGEGTLKVRLNGKAITARYLQQGHQWHLHFAGSHWCVAESKYDHDAFAEHGEKNSLQAPMPGSVVAIKSAVGALVAKGDPLLIIEAMKMEHTITAPYSGTVTSIHFNEGDLVQEGDELLALEEG